MNDMLANALELAERGYHLFPLRAGSKAPALRGNWQDVTTQDPRTLERWFARTNWNIAIACEPSGIFAVDLDTAKSGSDGPSHGIETLRELAHGRDLPRTLTVATPSGGAHLYYRQRADGPPLGNTVRRLGPLIDTRGVGGYLVAPGSHVDGTAYRITDDAPLAAVPDWISALLRPPEPAAVQPRVIHQVAGGVSGPYALAALRRETAQVENSQPGRRNDTLNRAAFSLGRFIADGLLDRSQVESQLSRAAQAAGLSGAETERTVDSGITAGIARHHGRTTTPPDPPSETDTFAWAAPAGPGPVAEETESPAPQPDSGAPPPKTLAALLAAFDALERELSEPTVVPAKPRNVDVEPNRSPSHHTSAEEAAEALDHVAAAIRDIEPRAAALVRTPEWQEIRAIRRAANDLVRQIRQAARDYADDLRTDVYINGAIRALAARTCHQISQLADAAATRLAQRGLDDSPTYGDLRSVQRAAQRAETKLTGRTPGQPEPEHYAAARRQLKQIRRDLRANACRQAPLPQASPAMRAAASRPQHR
jgi:Bifunctional DNA primase/polymerase, N-terminal